MVRVLRLGPVGAAMTARFQGPGAPTVREQVLTTARVLRVVISRTPVAMPARAARTVRRASVAARRTTRSAGLAPLMSIAAAVTRSRQAVGRRAKLIAKLKDLTAFQLAAYVVVSTGTYLRLAYALSAASVPTRYVTIIRRINYWRKVAMLMSIASRYIRILLAVLLARLTA